LARWASEELQRKEKQRSQVTSELKRLPKEVEEAAPVAAAPAAQDAHPEQEEVTPAETTGEVIARSGAQSSRRTLVFAAAAAAMVVIVLFLLWLATRGGSAAPAVKVEVAAPNRPALGGTGNDSSVGGLIKSDKPVAGQRQAAGDAKA